MDFLKIEGNQRYRQGKVAGRLEEAIHPEILCDHDILWWRQVDGENFNHRRNPEMCESDVYGTDLVRSNDVLSGNRGGEIFLYQDARTQILRVN